MLRIVAGEFRHRILEQPPLEITRPTQDRVREAIFSAIGTAVKDAVVLDAFAGSGAFGLEAISRGALSCDFFETNPIAFRVLKKNINALRVEEKVVLQFKDVVQFFDAKKQKEPYSLVFLDPPYCQKEVYEKIITLLFDANLLSNHAIIIKEAEEAFAEDPRFTKQKTYRYGRIHVFIGWR